MRSRSPRKPWRSENLRERIQQKYHLRLDDIRSECITITFADQGPAQVKTLTPEEMAAAGVSTDWTAVGEQVALQQRLDEMGPVNLVAIEEYEETEQRYQFLTTQNDDLVKAKQELDRQSSTGSTPRPRRCSSRLSTGSATTSGHVHRGLRRRQSRPSPGQRRRCARERHRDRRPSAGQAASEHLAAVGWRTDHDRGFAALRDLPGQAQPVLRARRVGRARWTNRTSTGSSGSCSGSWSTPSSSSSRTTSGRSAWPMSSTA
jgi:hypothetical protein